MAALLARWQLAERVIQQKLIKTLPALLAPAEVLIDPKDFPPIMTVTSKNDWHSGSDLKPEVIHRT